MRTRRIGAFMSSLALVTGGSRGIGLAICRRLHQEGIGIINFDKSEPEHRTFGHFIPVDLSDSQATENALTKASQIGNIAYLVNNVGIVMPAHLGETTLKDFDSVMALNVRCAIQCTQFLVPEMRKKNMGRIVNISSRAALGKELRTNYSASKAALIGLTRTWSLELASDEITVNCVCPGPIATELYTRANPPDSERTKESLRTIPVGRIGEPEDIA